MIANPKGIAGTWVNASNLPDSTSCGHEHIEYVAGMNGNAQVSPAQKGGAVMSSYLHPYVCFRCRKSFKRASRVEAVLTCPDCGGPSIGLTRKFKPPKRTDVDQWKKVEALVRHGFLFWSLGEPYPDTLKEVDAFAERHAEFVARERAGHPEAYAEIEAALAIAH